jgi:hypothetical protein
MTTPPPDPDSLRARTAAGPVQVTAAGMLQQRCGHNGCHAQRLSRPDGASWKPCWLCTTPAPPIATGATA